jgi:hypothetical protein
MCYVSPKNFFTASVTVIHGQVTDAHGEVIHFDGVISKFINILFLAVTETPDKDKEGYADE